MGTYLTTAIVTKISISGDDVKQFEGTEAEIFQKIQEGILGKPSDIFEVKRVVEKYSTIELVSYDFTVKEDILQREWIPFLQQFYTDFYGTDRECAEVITQLQKSKTSKDWFQLVKSDEWYHCYRDGDGYKERITIDGTRVRIWNECILLSLEGKVMAEACEQHLSFFERMIARAYEDFEIAGLVRVFITG